MTTAEAKEILQAEIEVRHEDIARAKAAIIQAVESDSGFAALTT